MADLKPCGYACAQKLTTAGPSSAYNQTVQWAIKEDEDKVEDLWRVYIILTKKRQEINQSLAVSELPVGGKSRSLSLLAAGNVRQVQTGSLSGNLRL